MKQRNPSVDKTTATVAPSNPLQVTSRLKAERIQDSLLNSAPAWTVSKDAKSIQRVQKFSDSRIAASYVHFVSELALKSRQTLILSLAEDRVALTLYGEPRRGRRDGGLTETSIALAAQIG